MRVWERNHISSDSWPIALNLDHLPSAEWYLAHTCNCLPDACVLPAGSAQLGYALTRDWPQPARYGTAAHCFGFPLRPRPTRKANTYGTTLCGAAAYFRGHMDRFPPVFRLYMALVVLCGAAYGLLIYHLANAAPVTLP